MTSHPRSPAPTEPALCGARWGAFGIGALVTLLAVAVCAGWLWHIDWIVQLGAAHSAMQFNTALGLAACGLGLVLAARARRTPVLVAAMVAGVLGTVTLAQYLTGHDLGIDRLVVEPFLTIGTSSPGRMSPQTALCFVMAGALLAARSLSSAREHRAAVDGIGGSMLAAGGLFVLAGHALGMESTYRWYDLTRMAPHTAASFALIGAGLLSLALAAPAGAGGRIRSWLPSAAVLAALFTGSLIWQTLHVEEQASARREFHTRATALSAALTMSMDEHRLALERMAQRWQSAGRVDEAAWREDARQYLEDLKGFEGVVWIDAARTRRWVEPDALARGLEVSRPTGTPRPIALLDRAVVVERSLITPTEELATAGPGFFIVVPLTVRGRSDGWLVGAMSCERLLKQSIAGHPDLGVRWLEGQGEVTQRPPPALPADGDAHSVFTVALGAPLIWTLEFSTRPGGRSFVPLLAWAAFGLLGGVVGLTLRLVHHSRDAAHRLLSANDLLVRESAERRAAERATAAILESAPDAILVVDPNGHILEANARASQLFGYSRLEFASLRLEDLLPEGDWPTHREQWAACFSSPAPRTLGTARSLTGRRRDGSVFPMEASLSPLVKEGEPAAVAVIRDMTEQYALLDARLRLAALVDGADDAILSTTLDGVIVSWNAGATRLYGFDEARMLGVNVERLVPEDRRPAERRAMDSLRAGGTIACLESVRVGREGSLLDVSVTISPIRDTAGRLTGASRIERDVTAQKAAERVIAHALEEKDVLLREIHHRVKNNLAVICSLLYLQSTNLTDEATKAVLQDSHDRVRSMAMVHEVLYGAANLAAVRFDEYLRNLSAHLLHVYAPARGSDARLVVELAPMVLSIDQAVPAGLAVNELLTNALKYGGGADGSAPVVGIVCSVIGDECVVSVTDNGPGFDGSANEARPRSLGLHLLRSLASQIGGHLQYQLLSRGTLACLTFPVDRSVRQEPSSPATVMARELPLET